MNAPLRPPHRAHDMSPISMGSEWSGMSNYNSATGGRSDSPYSTYNNMVDPVSPPDSGPPNPPPYRQNTFGPPSADSLGHRRPSETDSRGSSRAASIANSRSSDGTISDVQSRKYRRMETELHQHYAILRAYLRGGAQQPPRPNKARDKLLRLSPIQFHELSTDVFDELQRRQASAPLPGRPSRRDIPPFLQPRPDFHEKRNQARQKLSSLQTSRFKDLSTDVFCELERRFPHFTRPDGSRPASRAGRQMGPPLSGQNGYMPPPRSQSSGQSISGLGPGRRKGSQGGMSIHEGGPNGDYSRPTPRQFHSNTITPNKSTMVEDEDEMHGVDSRYDRSSDAFGLESALTSPSSNRDTSATSQSLGSMLGKPPHAQMTGMQQEIEHLKGQLKLKDEELSRRQSNVVEHEARERLERRLEELELTNQSMAEDLEHAQAEFEMSSRRGREDVAQAQADYANLERNLRGELEEARHAATLGRSDVEVRQENESLHQRLKQQQEIINDVRRQGQLHLEEMRAMASSGIGNFEQEDKLAANVQRLEGEVKDWKAKYIKAKTQLRSVRASSLGLSIVGPDLNRHTREAALYEEAGAVRDVHITKFQIAIDELLRIARSEPASVLDHMKTVVMAVRSITTDIDNASGAVKDEEMFKKRLKLKGRVSATANNVITASKNYAAAGGLSPVSLLDAAASHLTAAVVDLVRAVKIKPTPAGEFEDDDDHSETLQSNGYFNVAGSLKRRSAVDSIYSALSTPEEGTAADGPGPSLPRRAGSSYENGNGLSNGLGVKQGYGLRQEVSELEELKIYIENQSDELVAGIQVLIEAIRGEEAMTSIRSNIDKIVDTVDNVQVAAEKGTDEPTSYQSEWRAQTTVIYNNLEECKTRLLETSDECMSYDNHPSAKEFTQKLPPLAFQVARETRELVRRIQGIKAGGDDDFS